MQTSPFVIEINISKFNTYSKYYGQTGTHYTSGCKSIKRFTTNARSELCKNAVEVSYSPQLVQLKSS